MHLLQKKKKNTGQLDLTRNPTQPAIRLTQPEPDPTRLFFHVYVYVLKLGFGEEGFYHFSLGGMGFVELMIFLIVCGVLLGL